jgi:hypothetical protein
MRQGFRAMVPVFRAIAPVVIAVSAIAVVAPAHATTTKMGCEVGKQKWDASIATCVEVPAFARKTPVVKAKTRPVSSPVNPPAAAKTEVARPTNAASVTPAEATPVARPVEADLHPSVEAAATPAATTPAAMPASVAPAKPDDNASAAPAEAKPNGSVETKKPE